MIPKQLFCLVRRLTAMNVTTLPFILVVRLYSRSLFGAFAHLLIRGVSTLEIPLTVVEGIKHKATVKRIQTYIYISLFI